MEAKAYYKETTPPEVNIGSFQRLVSTVAGTYLLTSSMGEASRSPLNSVLRLLGGGYLLYRGATGHCAIQEALEATGKVLNIRTTLLVNASPYEVYMLWRDLEKLPTFMKHLTSVKEINDIRSHWTAQLPGGVGTLEWEAEILIDRKGEELSWHSVLDAVIENSGKIVFEGLNGGQSTLVHITITYNPPAGKVGKAVSGLFNDVFKNMIKEDLKRFKQMVEGEEGMAIQLKQGRLNGALATPE